MSFFRNKRLFILLIGIIILVSLIGYSLNGRDQITTGEKFIKDTVGWVQNIVSAPIKYTTSIFKNIGELKDTYDENQLLKEKISEYKTLIYDNQELEDDNKELRDILEKTETIRDYTPIQATVTSRSSERWVEQITIDKGTKDGVEQNMAVITADGMLGKIQMASGYTSTVQLLTGFDQFNRISAKVSTDKDKDVFGLIEAYDKESQSLKFKIIEESKKDVEEGDLVVSSGMGGTFPAGLLIGTVKEVGPDQYGLTQTALVEPAADMYSIDHVIVVNRDLSESDKPSDDQEEK